MVSVSQDTHPKHRPIMQAPVKALDPHGTVVISWGTGVFAIAALLLWWQRDTLESIGKGWWLTTAITGIGIGVLAIVVLSLRRARMRREAESRSATTTPDA